MSATSEEIEAALAAADFCTNADTRKWMRAALLAAEAVRAKTEVSEFAFSAGVYAVADVLCASQYVNAPDAGFVMALAHHAFAAGMAAQAATPMEAK